MTSTRNIPGDLLDAARDCVLAVGVRRTTLTDVARRAGVSRMTLYRKVPDAETLILAVVTREFTALVTEAEHEVAHLLDARSRLAASAALVVRRLLDEPLFRRVLEVDPDLFLPYLTERFGATQRIAHGQVRRLIREGIADGSIAVDDPDGRAWAIVTALSGLAVGAAVL